MINDDKVFSEDLSLRQFIGAGNSVEDVNSTVYESRLYYLHKGVNNGTINIPGLTDEADINRATKDGATTSSASTSRDGTVAVQQLVNGKTVVTKVTNANDAGAASNVEAYAVSVSHLLSKSYNKETTELVNKHIKELVGNYVGRSNVKIRIYCCTAIDVGSNINDLKEKYKDYEDVVDLIKNPNYYGLKEIDTAEYSQRETLLEYNLAIHCLDKINEHYYKEKEEALKNKILKNTPWKLLLFPQSRINEIEQQMDKLYGLTISYDEHNAYRLKDLLKLMSNMEEEDENEESENQVIKNQIKKPDKKKNEETVYGKFIVKENVDMMLMPAFYRAITYSKIFKDSGVIKGTIYEYYKRKNIETDQTSWNQISDILGKANSSDFNNIEVDTVTQLYTVEQFLKILDNLSSPHFLNELMNIMKKVYKLQSFIKWENTELNIYHSIKHQLILDNKIANAFEKLDGCLIDMQKLLIFKEKQQHYKEIEKFIYYIRDYCEKQIKSILTSKLLYLNIEDENAAKYEKCVVSHVMCGKHIVHFVLENPKVFIFNDKTWCIDKLVNYIHKKEIEYKLGSLKQNEKVNDTDHVNSFIDKLNLTKDMKKSFIDVVLNRINNTGFKFFEDIKEMNNFSPTFLSALSKRTFIDENKVNEFKRDLKEKIDEFLTNDSFKFLCEKFGVEERRDFQSVCSKLSEKRAEISRISNSSDSNITQEIISIPDKNNNLYIPDFENIDFIFHILSTKVLLFNTLNNIIDCVRNKQLVYQRLCVPNLEESMSIEDIVNKFKFNSSFVSMIKNALKLNSQDDEANYELDQIFENVINIMLTKPLFEDESAKYVDEDGFEVFAPFKGLKRVIVDKITEINNEINNDINALAFNKNNLPKLISSLDDDDKKDLPELISSLDDDNESTEKNLKEIRKKIDEKKNALAEEMDELSKPERTLREETNELNTKKSNLKKEMDKLIIKKSDLRCGMIDLRDKMTKLGNKMTNLRNEMTELANRHMKEEKKNKMKEEMEEEMKKCEEKYKKKENEMKKCEEDYEKKKNEMKECEEDYKNKKNEWIEENMKIDKKYNGMRKKFNDMFDILKCISNIERLKKQKIYERKPIKIDDKTFDIYKIVQNLYCYTQNPDLQNPDLQNPDPENNYAKGLFENKYTIDNKSFSLSEIFEIVKNGKGEEMLVLKDNDLDKRLKIYKLTKDIDIKPTGNINQIIPIQDKFKNWYEIVLNEDGKEYIIEDKSLNIWNSNDAGIENYKESLSKCNNLPFGETNSELCLIDTFVGEGTKMGLNVSKEPILRFLVCVPNAGIPDRYRNRMINRSNVAKILYTDPNTYPKYFLPIFPTTTNKPHFYTVKFDAFEIVQNKVNPNTFRSLNERFKNEFENDIIRMIYEDPNPIKTITYKDEYSDDITTITDSLYDVIISIKRFQELCGPFKNLPSSLTTDKNYKNILCLYRNILPLVVDYSLNGKQVPEIQKLFKSIDNETQFLKGINKDYIFDYGRFSNRFKKIIKDNNNKTFDIRLTKLPLIIETTDGKKKILTHVCKNFDGEEIQINAQTPNTNIDLKRAVEDLIYLYIALCISIIMSNKEVKELLGQAGLHISSHACDALTKNESLIKLIYSSIGSYICYHYELEYDKRREHIKKGSSLLPLLNYNQADDPKMDLLRCCLKSRKLNLSSIEDMNTLTARFYNDIDLFIENISNTE